MSIENLMRIKAGVEQAQKEFAEIEHLYERCCQFQKTVIELLDDQRWTAEWPPYVEARAYLKELNLRHREAVQRYVERNNRRMDGPMHPLDD